MKIALLGYGKMGKTIEKLALEKGHDIVFVSDKNTDFSNLKYADVAIEFSVPEAAFQHITTCFEMGIPVVSGTTGWLTHYDEALKVCQQRNGSFIYASNFSIGVNLFFELNRKLAEMMSAHKGYTVTMEEIHHTQKLDAPSGTAISLANAIIENTHYASWHLGKTAENEERSLPIEAKREGDVKGTHIVKYQSKIDTISIAHEAHSREGFALGSVIAAEWLIGKKGVFSMKDVLGL
ncbi:MAG TPA: 4-hydroxy-tetrahydrodipicolinate reductase [Flavobacteriaceae bacterium]|nr:4-hydroxy-tetrahydrodipicolinate reductase [Flavobacteriaceae bacterium]